MDLSENYHNYITCINARELHRLGEFVSEDVVHNGRSIGLDGYRDMLAGNYHDIPDLHFVVELLVAEISVVASRLYFNCKPKAKFKGLQINGQQVEFHENVFYRYKDGKIAEVWSVIDKAEIEKQLVP